MNLVQFDAFTVTCNIIPENIFVNENVVIFEIPLKFHIDSNTIQTNLSIQNPTINK